MAGSDALRRDATTPHGDCVRRCVENDCHAGYAWVVLSRLIGGVESDVMKGSWIKARATHNGGSDLSGKCIRAGRGQSATHTTGGPAHPAAQIPVHRGPFALGKDYRAFG